MINGTTTNASVYPAGVIERIQIFMDSKLTENYNNNNGRRRRLLQTTTVKRYIKVEEETAPTFYANTSFTHNMRITCLYESEMSFVSTQLTSSAFIDDLKSVSGFDNSATAAWSVPGTNIKSVAIPTSVKKPEIPSLKFNGLLDKKGILEWNYDTVPNTNPHKLHIIGGGSLVDTYRVTWHPMPDDKRLVYASKGTKDPYLGTPCSPPFTTYPCNNTIDNVNTTQIGKDLNTSVRSITIDNLVNGLAYRFTLTIKNEYGLETQLSSSTYIPVGTMGTVQIQSIEAVDQGIKVKYNLTKNFGNGRPIDYIKIEGLQKDNNDCGTPTTPRTLENVIITDANLNEALLSGLETKKNYFVRLTVHVFYEDTTSTNVKAKTMEEPSCANVATESGLYITGRPIMSNDINITVNAGENPLEFNDIYRIDIN
jgi:hypothetical protein